MKMEEHVIRIINESFRRPASGLFCSLLITELEVIASERLCVGFVALKWLTFCKTFGGERLQIVDMVMWSICPPSPLVVLVYPPVYGSQSGGELTFCGVSDGLARCGRQYPPVCVSIACPVRLFPLVPLVGQPATVLRVCPHSQTNFASFNIA